MRWDVEFEFEDAEDGGDSSYLNVVVEADEELTAVALATRVLYKADGDRKPYEKIHFMGASPKAFDYRSMQLIGVETF